VKRPRKPASEFPKRLKEGNASVTIYRQSNPSRRRNPRTGAWEPTGQVHDEFVLAYYLGTRTVLDEATRQPVQDPRTGMAKVLPRLVRQKFANLGAAEAEARLVLAKLANAEGEALRLTGLDRANYVHAVQELRRWRPEASLTAAVNEYVAAVRRLPEGVTLERALDDYLRRHPAGLPRKTVREVVDELVAAKAGAGRSTAYVSELQVRLARFAQAFAVPVGSVSGAQINDWILGLGLSGRTQINFRRVISTMFKFAKRRGYLPKDWDEMAAVERPDDDGGEIEVFTPDELRRLFAACVTPVRERGGERTRQEMIPGLAIAAFAGLRAAEIKRLDWAEVHLTGPEPFIEVKASKAKTASRRLVPILQNLSRWLMPYAQASGPVVPVERLDKQWFQYLGPAAGVTWKRNALRHSFISYRLAIIKDAGQVSLEAGNSAAMVFKHYRQVVTETQAREWFDILPPQAEAAEIIALPKPASPARLADDECPADTAISG
jgi:integrase